jgi:molecular chaperone DnaJ
MVQSVQTCPDCRGTGKIIKEKCSVCGGSGYTSSRKKIQVSIPAGIDNGQSIRIRGKGEPGVNGGPRGDMLVEVSVGTHPQFVRQDMDIFSNVDITFAQAALGCDLRVSTVDGDVIYTVKPGTQSGMRVRLKGKGVPSVRNKTVRGDHYVTLTVRTPSKLSEEAKRLMKEFDAATGNSLNQNQEETQKDGTKGKKKGFFDKLKENFED